MGLLRGAARAHISLLKTANHGVGGKGQHVRKDTSWLLWLHEEKAGKSWPSRCQKGPRCLGRSGPSAARRRRYAATSDSTGAVAGRKAGWPVCRVVGGRWRKRTLGVESIDLEALDIVKRQPINLVQTAISLVPRCASHPRSQSNSP